MHNFGSLYYGNLIILHRVLGILGRSSILRYLKSLIQNHQNHFMISSIYILDNKGKVLITRDYRGDTPSSVIDSFLMLLADLKGDPVCVLHIDSLSYSFVTHNNLYLLAVSNGNSNAATILLILLKLITVFVDYFGSLEEESIKDNFVVIYELLDEMIDFGYPQTTDSKILKEYITQESHILLTTATPTIPQSVTNAVSWRSEGIKYRKNEVFLDVIESVNLLVNSNGNVLRSEILGAVKMKCFLTGMPDVRLGLNDKILFENTGRTKGKAVEMEDVKFHQCVRLSRFETDRTISFIPPDGLLI